MIDLHLHTSASDGDYAPREVVTRAWQAGLRTIAITDHDTVAGIPEAQHVGAELGVRVIAGIEITAVHEERDIHVLGYFVDPACEDLLAFLTRQRLDRVARVREMAGRLGALGMPIDADALLAPFALQPGRSVGRPAVARALVDAGHVPTMSAAFDTLIGAGRSAFVPRRGATPGAVVAVIHSAGGVASLAHPGLIRRDDMIPQLVSADLDALEVYHSDHSPEDVARYRAIALQHSLAVTGGSDFHGESRHPRATLGAVTLPSEEFERLAGRVPARQPGRA
jgi:3',5'-nucleoside bisphosphate phosphatase